MTLLLIAIIGGMMILFVFVLNLSKVLAVKEQANTTAQQASLATTSVIYDHIWDSINRYEQTLIGKVDQLPEPIAEKVNNRQVLMRNDPRYNDYSDNEIYIQAIDFTLKDELTSGVGRNQLKQILEEDLDKLRPEMINTAREIVDENNGNVVKSKIQIYGDRIHISASSDFTASTYDKFFKGFKEKLFQTSAGPKIDFLSELSIWKDETISLSSEEEVNW